MCASINLNRSRPNRRVREPGVTSSDWAVHRSSHRVEAGAVVAREDSAGGVRGRRSGGYDELPEQGGGGVQELEPVAGGDWRRRGVKPTGMAIAWVAAGEPRGGKEVREEEELTEARGGAEELAGRRGNRVARACVSQRRLRVETSAGERLLGVGLREALVGLWACRVRELAGPYIGLQGERERGCGPAAVLIDHFGAK